MSTQFDKLLPLLVGGRGYRDLLAHSFVVKGFGVEFNCVDQFNCVDLPTLIKLKRAAGRPKDLIDCRTGSFAGGTGKSILRVQQAP